MYKLEYSSFINEYRYFNFLDYYFAYSLLGKIDKNNEDQFLFLCYLLKAAQYGNLCLNISEDKVLPKVRMICENISNEEEEDLTAKIISGAKSLPNELISNDEKDIKPVIKNNELYYLQKNWKIETKILKEFYRLVKDKPKDNIDVIKFKNFIEELHTSKSIKDDQKQALNLIFFNSVSIIYGGPGTGKTTLCSYLIKSLEASVKDTFKVVITAPTGRATQNLIEKITSSEKTQIIASTLHSLLNISYDKISKLDSFIEADLIIVDEASMVDATLIACLLEKIKSKSRIIFIGDPYQLPSIESGSIFSDFISINKDISFELKNYHRFEKKQLIEFSEHIKNNDLKKALETVNNTKNDKINLISKIDQDYFINCIENNFALPSSSKPDIKKLLGGLQKFRMLSCFKKGPFGTTSINEKVIKYFFRRYNNKKWWSVPIIITKNIYSKNLLNGMIGILITEVDNYFSIHNCQGFVYFQELEDPININDIHYYDLAYCISVHKSQGSEFDKAVLFLNDEAEIFPSNLLYTAVTRAKKEISIIGKEKTIQTMLKNPTNRISGLKKRILFN